MPSQVNPLLLGILIGGDGVGSAAVTSVSFSLTDFNFILSRLRIEVLMGKP